MRRWPLALLSVAVLGVLCIAGAGELLSRPVRADIGSPPDALEAQRIEIPYGKDQHIAGWFASGTPGAGIVLLLHGVRADRRQMIGRAKFLRARGLAVVLIDLPSHGESTGDRITFGVREADGVRATLDWMSHQWPTEALGIIGVSLGAASTLIAGPDTRVRAMVLESMYPTIDEAVADRLRVYLGPAGPALAPLLLQQIPLRTGIPLAALRPVERVAAVQVPLFIVSGAQDTRTTAAETRRIFEAARPPKELWIVDGAEHIDLHAFAPEIYEARIGDFLDRSLRPGSPTAASAASRIPL